MSCRAGKTPARPLILTFDLRIRKTCHIAYVGRVPPSAHTPTGTRALMLHTLLSSAYVYLTSPGVSGDDVFFLESGFSAEREPKSNSDIGRPLCHGIVNFKLVCKAATDLAQMLVMLTRPNAVWYSGCAAVDCCCYGFLAPEEPMAICFL